MRFYTMILVLNLITSCGDDAPSAEEQLAIGQKINPETKTTNLDDEDDETIAECQSPDPIVQIVDKEVIVEVPLADNQFYDSIGDNLWVKGGSTTIAMAQLACSDGFRLPSPSELQLGLSRGLTHSSSHLWTNEDEGYNPINNKHWWRAVTTADAGLSSGHETNVFGVVCIEEK